MTVTERRIHRSRPLAVAGTDLDLTSEFFTGLVILAYNNYYYVWLSFPFLAILCQHSNLRLSITRRVVFSVGLLLVLGPRARPTWLLRVRLVPRRKTCKSGGDRVVHAKLHISSADWCDVLLPLA